MFKKSMFALIAITVISATAFASTFFVNRNEVIWQTPLFYQGQPTGFTTIYMRDNNNVENTCIFILINEATKQFQITAVHPKSCGIPF